MSGYAADAAPAAAAAPAAEGKKEKAGKKDAKASAPAVPAGPPPAEKSAEELAKMSKEERGAYHQARRAAGAGPGGAAAGASATAAPTQLSKQERRALQDAQRKVKEDKANAGKEGDELFEELKLQGLTEDQARQVQNEIKAGHVIDDEDEDDDEEDADDLLGSVRKWMSEQEPGEIPEEMLRDFNMKVRFQGHVNTTPPDHLGAMLTVLVEQAHLAAANGAAAKPSPSVMCKILTPLLERWANILRGLYSKIPDVLEAVGVVVATISSAVEESAVASGAAADLQDAAVVGCLMAVRELDDLVEDEDLLVGCKGIEPKSRVLEKFIEFLEDALEEDDEDGEDDDEE